MESARSKTFPTPSKSPQNGNVQAASAAAHAAYSELMSKYPGREPAKTKTPSSTTTARWIFCSPP
jgi:hypothetical protein